MKIVGWIFKSMLLVLKYAIAFALIVAIIQHFITPVYNFPEGKKFEGNVLYNPYKDSKYEWLKMNMHAHSKAWGGLTDGKKQNNDEIIREYARLGYDIIGISNYHDPQRIYFKGAFDSLTIYEYGINLFKAHRLVIGYQPAKFREVMFFHTLHDRQYIINNTYPDCEVMIIAHPQFGKGHEMNDFKYLSNYHLIEVLNHYRYSEGEWDLALSNGKPVFIIGNDDMHDLTKPGEVAVRYTMVDGKENLLLTLEELKKGNAFAMASPEHNCVINLLSCKVEGMYINIELSDTADKIQFITDHGVVSDSIIHNRSASYTLRPDETYVRTIVFKGSCKLYTNPFFRTTDGVLPKNEQSFSIHWPATIAEKLGLILAMGIVLLFILKTRIRF